jgi:hypothetical protein
VRKHVGLKTKLAAALRELAEIPMDHAREMTADQVLSLFQFNHILLHADNKQESWVDEHWNIEPLLIKAHRERTAKIDVPQVAKTKRISKEHQDFVQRLLAPRDERQPRRSKWPKRKMTGPKNSSKRPSRLPKRS